MSDLHGQLRQHFHTLFYQMSFCYPKKVIHQSNKIDGRYISSLVQSVDVVIAVTYNAANNHFSIPFIIPVAVNYCIIIPRILKFEYHPNKNKIKEIVMKKKEITKTKKLSS